MEIPLFLAQSAQEMAKLEQYPLLTCPFSQRLPDFSGAMLVLTDETPPKNLEILAQITELNCRWILLDFQRPGDPMTVQIAKAITEKATCPVAVAEPYAAGLSCPVFLPPVPPHVSLEAHLAPWRGREIWLDVSASPTRIRIDRKGSQISPLSSIDHEGICHEDKNLCCHYFIRTGHDEILFDLFRTREDISALLKNAALHGVTTAVGLYQERQALPFNICPPSQCS